MRKMSVVITGILLVMLAFGGMAYAAHGRINVNTASVEELRLLPGLGDTLAASIVEFRDVNGPFNSIDDLLKVNGMTEPKLNEFREDFKLEGETDFDPETYKQVPDVYRDTQPKKDLKK